MFVTEENSDSWRVKKFQNIYSSYANLNVQYVVSKHGRLSIWS